MNAELLNRLADLAFNDNFDAMLELIDDVTDDNLARCIRVLAHDITVSADEYTDIYSAITDILDGMIEEA